MVTYFVAFGVFFINTTEAVSIPKYQMLRLYTGSVSIYDVIPTGSVSIDDVISSAGYGLCVCVLCPGFHELSLLSKV